MFGNNFYPPYLGGYGPQMSGPGSFPGWLNMMTGQYHPGSSHNSISKGKNRKKQQIAEWKSEQPLSELRFAFADEGGKYVSARSCVVLHTDKLIIAKDISEEDLMILQDPTFDPKSKGWRPVSRSPSAV